MLPLIEVQNVSKMYKVVNPSSRIKEPFWSLRDINFQVERGQSLTLIGHNGAGKSTLMRIIANITSPTRGQVIVRGTTAAMLELGAGFHHELTGRENTYVYGALLGIKRNEIKEKLDEIIAFAGVEQFIDTRVRSYSNGMILRLAFSITSSLRPDVILADELLAVADDKFKKKCLNRMKTLKEEGTAIIMVQHDIETVKLICDDVIFLDKGEIKSNGKLKDFINI